MRRWQQACLWRSQAFRPTPDTPALAPHPTPPAAPWPAAVVPHVAGAVGAAGAAAGLGRGHAVQQLHNRTIHDGTLCHDAPQPGGARAAGVGGCRQISIRGQHHSAIPRHEQRSDLHVAKAAGRASVRASRRPPSAAPHASRASARPRPAAPSPSPARQHRGPALQRRNAAPPSAAPGCPLPHLHVSILNEHVHRWGHVAVAVRGPASGQHGHRGGAPICPMLVL